MNQLFGILILLHFAVTADFKLIHCVCLISRIHKNCYCVESPIFRSRNFQIVFLNIILCSGRVSNSVEDGRRASRTSYMTLVSYIF